jgi:hypothetical protein
MGFISQCWAFCWDSSDFNRRKCSLVSISVHSCSEGIRLAIHQLIKSQLGRKYGLVSRCLSMVIFLGNEGFWAKVAIQVAIRFGIKNGHIGDSH